MKTRRYQDDAILELMQARESGSKSALIVMAPSLGKTVVSAIDAQYFLDENPEARVLYLCHTNEVLDQAKKTFKKVFGDERSYGFYNGLIKSNKTDFLFASFQTMGLHKVAFSPDEFDYIIVDEAHHAPATTFKTVVRYFNPKFLLGLTATPNRLDGLNLNEIFGEVVYSMDLVESIVRGYVADVDYRLMLDEMQELNSIFIDGEKLSIAEINRRLFIPKRDKEIVRLIEQKIAERKSPRTMIFCCSVEHAENIANLIEGAEVVHSKIGEKECLRRIARFRKGQTKTIVSVDQLNEGVDIPQADVIVFLRSTVSPVVFYQQLGRGLRLHDDKDGVLILDFVGNCERLETINNLYCEIKERQERFIERTKKEMEVKEHFTLNIDTPKFREQLVDIRERINSLKWQAYTKDQLIEKLQIKFKELGRVPTRREIDADPRMPSNSTFQRVFGTWIKALKAAGFKATTEKGLYTREILIEMLQAKAKELGHNPPDRGVGLPNASVFVRVFGSWGNALIAAGLKGKKSHYSDDELIKMLREKAKELGRNPLQKDLDDDPNMPSKTAYYDHFGGWNEALEKAGLEVAKAISYTDEQLISILQERAKQLGRVPTRRHMKSPCPSTFRAHFGSWPNALKAAGLIS